MPDYLNVVYDKKIRPQTKYPFQLCKHLFKRFDMKKGAKLLDVGCGRGDFIKGFKDLGLEVSGIDREFGDPETLKGIEVKLVDFEKDSLPFNSDTFDFVFSKSVIEHFWNPEHFIKECHRILKPKGTIIVMTPDWQSQRLIFYDDYTHCHPYTPTALKDLLEINGFKEASSEIFYQLPVLWKYPWLGLFSKLLQIAGPVKKIHKNKFIRWSRELMILSSGIR
jgi:ubiquinone/menaquinone biosynthesis C-methylase UbiE